MLRLTALLAAILIANPLAAQDSASGLIFRRPELIASITPRNIYDGMSGAISPDGKSLVYVRIERDKRVLWLLDVATGRTRLLTPRVGTRYDPVWSYDGRQIAYWGEVVQRGSSEMLEGIWVLDVASEVERLSFATPRFGLAFSPSWTRDGRIVFGLPNDFWNQQPMMLDPHTGIATPIAPKIKRIRDPSVSPDGEQIAFLGASCADGKGSLGIISVADSGTKIRCLGSDARSGAAPVWSPDGRTLFILGAAADDSLPHVIAIDVASGVRRQIDDTGVHGEILRISMSRDGHLILVANSGSLRVGTVPVTGGIPAVFPRDTMSYTALPVWSNDGAVIGALTGLPHHWGRQEKMFVVQLDAGLDDATRGARKPSNTYPDSLTYGAVSPDGRCIVSDDRGDRSDMRAVGKRSLFYSQSPYGYGHAGVPNADFGYDGALQWSDDGLLVLKQSFSALYVVQRDTLAPGGCGARGPWQRVELGGFHGSPVGWHISPDSRSIAFSRLPKTDDAPGIFVVPAMGGTVRTLRLLPRDGSFSAPEWSRDGLALYFADADSAGTYRILRITIANSAVDTITRGPLGAVHPRLSPDGHTLAVTIVNAKTTIWRMDRSDGPLPMLGSTTSRPARATLPPPTVPDARLVDLVKRVAAHDAALERMWPGYWSATQPYALVSPTSPGVLLVAEEALVTGFEEIKVAAGPARLRVFWRPSLMMSADALRLPYVEVPSVPAANASAATVARWREEALRTLFYGHDGFLENPRWDPPKAHPKAEVGRYAFCMDGLIGSCVAARRLERRVLAAALAAPAHERAALAGQYAAVRWVRRASGTDQGWGEERLLAMRQYVARSAAALVAGGDMSRYARDVVARFAALPVADTGSREVGQHFAEATGQAVAVLLDRLGYDWHPTLARGDDFFDALMQAVHFDSATALRTAKRTYAAFGMPTLLEQTRLPSDTSDRALSSRNYTQQYYYWNLLHAIARDSIPLALEIPGRRGVIDTSIYRIRYVAGRGDSASTLFGLVALPDPDSFIVEAPGLRIEVHHVPVLIDPGGTVSLGTRITFFLPDSVISQIRPRRLETDSELLVRGPYYDMWFGRGTSVAQDFGPPALYVRPKAQARKAH